MTKNIYYSENQSKLMVLDDKDVYTTEAPRQNDGVLSTVIIANPDFYTGDYEDVDWDTDRNGDVKSWGSINGREVLYTEDDSMVFLENQVFTTNESSGLYGYNPNEEPINNYVALGELTDEDYVAAKNEL